MTGKNHFVSAPHHDSNDREIIINGFGACMISGLPYDFENSFFYQAIHILSRRLERTVSGRVFSYGGFPAHRAVTYIHKSFADHPEFVVVQLGSTDLIVSLNHYIRSILSREKVPMPAPNPKKKKGGIPCGDLPFRRSILRLGVELVKLSACRIMSVAPIHGDRAKYLTAMASAVEAIQSAGAIPVLLAPFPQGDLVSSFWAVKFTAGLQDLAHKKGAVFVDTHGGLADIPRSKLLLSDKLHLSKLGHLRVGQLIASEIEKNLCSHPAPKELSLLSQVLAPASLSQAI